MQKWFLNISLILMTITLSACPAPNTENSSTASGNNGSTSNTGSSSGSAVNVNEGSASATGSSSGTNATATVQGKTYTEEQVRAAIACMKTSTKANLSTTAGRHEVLLNTAAETGDQAKVSTAMTAVIAGTLVLQDAANMNCL